MKEVGKLDSEHPVIRRKVDKSLKLSVTEGSYASASSALGPSYFSPFALAMNATSSQIGILSAISNLLPGIAQLFSTDLIERYSRKKIVLINTILQNLIYIPLILCAVLYFVGVPYMIWITIGLMGIFYSVGAVAHPAWFSWMGSLVPKEKRGKYFSARNRRAGFFGLVAMIIGAIFLDYMKKGGSATGNLLEYTLIGFGILFLVAFVTRMISISYFSRQYEPRVKIHKKDYFTLRQFIRKAPETAFGRFTIFNGVLRIGIAIASPFFAVYLLRNLGFSYLWYMAITVAGVLFQLAFYPIVGKISDIFGNAFLTKVSSILLALAPFAWLFSPLFGGIYLKIYLLTVPSLIGGLAWAGFNIATTNYVYDSVRQSKQSFCLSYLTFFNGVGMFIGSLIGSGLALMSIPFMENIAFIFLVSGIVRFGVALVGSKYMGEVRPVKKFSSNFLIKEFVPAQGIVRIVHQLNHNGSVKHHL